MLPIQVRHNKSLLPVSKVVFSEIYDLVQVTMRSSGDLTSSYCYAKDEHFAEVLGISLSTAKRAVKQLREANLIYTVAVSSIGRGTDRRIYLAQVTLSQAEVDVIKRSIYLYGRSGKMALGRATSDPSTGSATSDPSIERNEGYTTKKQPLRASASDLLDTPAFLKALRENSIELTSILSDLRIQHYANLEKSVHKFFVMVNSERTFDQWLVKLRGWLASELQDLTGTGTAHELFDYHLLTSLLLSKLK